MNDLDALSALVERVHETAGWSINRPGSGAAYIDALAEFQRAFTPDVAADLIDRLRKAELVDGDATRETAWRQTSSVIRRAWCRRKPTSRRKSWTWPGATAGERFTSLRRKSAKGNGGASSTGHRLGRAQGLTTG